MKDLDEVLAYLATELLGWITETVGPYKTVVFMKQGKLWREKDELGKDLLTGNGMLEIVEAMQSRGFIHGHHKYDGAQITFWFTSDDHDALVEDIERLPEAVARAAYAALQEQENRDAV